MRVAFVVNAWTEIDPRQTTALLVARGLARGDEVWVVDVDALGRAADGSILAWAVRASDGRRERIALDGVDAVLVRTNPARDPRGWAHQAALVLLRSLKARGVPVSNDPESLIWATHKLNLLELPIALRPRTLVTRDRDALVAFVADAPGDVVLKPTGGTRGRDVFRARRDAENLSQILDVLTRDGLAMAQDFVPEAVDGDVRVLVLDGAPLVVGGQVAAVRRVPPAHDFRSNVAVGGTVAPVWNLPHAVLHTVAHAAPLLHQRGVRLAGLDLVGAKVVEVNVFSPGGLWEAELLYEVDFSGALLDVLTRSTADRSRGPCR